MDSSLAQINLAETLELAVFVRQPDGRLAVSHTPSWWSPEIGTLDDGYLTVISPFLADFMLDATEHWSQLHTTLLSSALFELPSPAGDRMQLQAFAAHHPSQPFLLVRNLNAIDGWITDVLQRAHENLLDHSQQRSRHRHEVRQLAADRDEAQRMEQMKGEFLASMSHEIRTPLTTIMGMASLALKPEADRARRDEYISSIRNAAERLLKLGNDILDLSRIQADRMTLEIEAFSLQDLLHDFRTESHFHAAEKGLNFELQVAPGTPAHSKGDAFRLRQVLTNLVNNALKFTEQGSVQLLVQPSDTAAEFVRFEVRDTGVGMPAATLDSIFDSFTQVDGSSRRRHQGAGLGLSIAAKLVELMRGNLRVRSELGIGSSFYFEAYLPKSTQPTTAANIARPATTVVAIDSAAEAPDNAPPIVEPTAAQEPAEIPPARAADGEIRVLVAEDHELNRSIIVESLQADGMQVVEAENGLIALEHWTAEPFDVVLMDCQMPVMNGLDAIDAIRKAEQSHSRHTPIIALTAQAMRQEMQRLLDHGADHYLSKPFDPDRLVALVHEAVHPAS